MIKKYIFKYQRQALTLHLHDSFHPNLSLGGSYLYLKFCSSQIFSINFDI